MHTFFLNLFHLYYPLNVMNKEVHQKEVTSVNTAYSNFKHVCDVPLLTCYGWNSC